MADGHPQNVLLVKLDERSQTVADMLILSNVLMILLNMVAIHLSPQTGLVLAMFMLLCASCLP